MVKWFWIAVQFATILPTPRLREVSVEALRHSVMFYPVVGMGLGAVLWGADWVLSHRLPALASTLCALALYTLLGGALHLDGLMDTADAVGSRRPRAQALDIMKDSRVGAMGVVAAVFVIGGKVSALSSLPPGAIGVYLAVPAVSRACMVLSMALSPAAREGGLGAVYARQIPAAALWTTVGLALVVCAVSLPLEPALLLLVVGAVVTIAFTWFVRVRFGGTTGDTYGALNELVEWIGWTVLVMAHGA
ncbi:adenosylcobinamide-GDP ribazoletransferase [Alicyclobacillus cycloheptanicus]|nr:adenosylcobinamide-GDP ribazoletransferase [Alicyclobacillus cycloheptanicus]